MKKKLSAVLAAATVIAGAADAHALAPGWRIVGLDEGGAAPKYLFDVPPHFTIDGTRTSTTPISNNGSAIIRLTTAGLNSPCGDWMHALIFLQAVDANQQLEFSATPSYQNKVITAYFGRFTQHPHIHPAGDRRYNIGRVPAHRYDVDVDFPRTKTTCNTEHARVTFVRVGTRALFTFFRDRGVRGSVRDQDAEGIVNSLRTPPAPHAAPRHPAPRRHR